VDRDAQDRFRANLRGYMARTGITWSALADELGMSRQRLDAIVMGRRPVRPEFAQRVADLFRLPLHFLTGVEASANGSEQRLVGNAREVTSAAD
jgi:plasmid maintenance system antidote protein VapI